MATNIEGLHDTVVWEEGTTSPEDTEVGTMEAGALEPKGRRSVEIVRRRDRESAPRFVESGHTLYVGRRASGKGYSYWSPNYTVSWKRTRDGLVLRTVFEHRKHQYFTSHVFAGSEEERRDHFAGPARIHARQAFDGVVGSLPVIAERFPLGEQIAARLGRDTFEPEGAAPWPVVHTLLDAEDFAQVARQMYGAKSYRKPLGRAVEHSELSVHPVLMPFRGLVPIDWIIDAYRAEPEIRLGYYFTSVHMRTWRLLIRAVGEADRRRFLREIAGGGDAVSGMIYDCARYGANLDVSAVKTALEGREIGRIRSLHDLHQLVTGRMDALVDDGYRTVTQKAHDRQRTAVEVRAAELIELRHKEADEKVTGVHQTWEQWMAGKADRDADAARRQEIARQAREIAERERREAREREQAQWDADHPEAAARRRREEERRRHAEEQRETWHKGTREAIEKLTIGAMSVRVARDASTLTAWSETLDNCIRSYRSSLRRDLLVGIYEGDQLVANAQITYERGLVQMLGRHNRDLPAETFEQIADALGALDIDVSSSCWGAPAERRRPVAA
ncbi:MULTISPECIES: hypothetical protein [Brachybacterium]|uniref:Uncharacterized protein n=1 Tax=Brachybacterium kimchii TaxID=2942909 RepID=A0ABY4N7R5_9MICO|nr:MULTISPECIES: hypothetical protein [Brachybacterium]MCG7308049.1 hypothetical protein [Brachybacterium sp. ACRRE]UQN30587.1 hypothetical protein M4486_04540 [Brachybacterium kimchii]